MNYEFHFAILEMFYWEDRFKEARKADENIELYDNLLGKSYRKVMELYTIIYG